VRAVCAVLAAPYLAPRAHRLPVCSFFCAALLCSVLFPAPLARWLYVPSAVKTEIQRHPDKIVSFFAGPFGQSTDSAREQRPAARSNDCSKRSAGTNELLRKPRQAEATARGAPGVQVRRERMRSVSLAAVLAASRVFPCPHPPCDLSLCC
jgi:hypothetical protein